MSLPRVLIGTAPVVGDGWGGVTTMANTLYHHLVATGRYDPFLIYNTLRNGDRGNLPASRILRGRLRVGEQRQSFWGMEGVQLGRRLPALEILHYFGNLPEWSRWIRGFDILQVVGGYNHCGLAFALSGRLFVCWVATTLDEDRMGREDRWPRWRRAADMAQRPVLRAFEGLIFRRARKIMTLSAYTADLIARRYGFARRDILVIPQPIDTDWFSPAPAGDGPGDVLFVGRLDDDRKNLSFLVRVFARVHARLPGARLVLVGGEPKASLISDLAALKLNGAVEFHECVPHPETVAYFRKAAVFAIPSVQEGLGISGLEAMACGVPVVSTRCGGAEDYVRDGENGFLIDQGDEEGFADRLYWLLVDANLRRKLGQQARVDAKEKFSSRRLLSVFECVYREVWPELLPERPGGAAAGGRVCPTQEVA